MIQANPITVNPITALMMRRFPLIVDRKRNRVNYIRLTAPRGYLPAVYGCEQFVKGMMEPKLKKVN